jgi:hypothetical protein
MAHVGKDAEAKALSQPHAQPCLGTGGPMARFIMVDQVGIAESRALSRWFEMARAYVSRLPPKIASTEP